ncbi:cystathionine beta-lyase PatB [Oscillospiraceae bacterium]|nr:cystathionine beta-lyase PatB [Oscillospiraceae bacterium]BDF76759.1 cystathionine beta-lyase PatB [Oscillospiraceae bacterium]
MNSQFDLLTERRGTCSVKWDAADRAFGGENLLPMWIADMDFPAAPGILDSLSRRVEQGVFGYGTLSQAYYDAVIGWMERRHHCKVERDWIVYTAGVVTALNYAVQAATEPGDEILVPSPVYGPFYHAVEDWGRVLVKCPLKNEALRYTFDFEDMERRVTPRTRALMLCSPHNPVGRVWERAELEELAAFCLRHNLSVIADEIHNDLVFRAHTMFLNVSPELAGRTILCTAPSKTFNLAGIQASNIIIPGEALRQKYRAAVARNHGSSANSFVQAAVLGAYNDSERWLDELLEYLDGNMALFCGTVERELPKLRVRRPEGTYMTWVDCSGLGLEPGALKRFFVDRCGLALSDGAGFGEEGAGFMRFNLACPRATVEECLRRLKENCR